MREEDASHGDERRRLAMLAAHEMLTPDTVLRLLGKQLDYDAAMTWMRTNAVGATELMYIFDVHMLALAMASHPPPTDTHRLLEDTFGNSMIGSAKQSLLDLPLLFSRNWNSFVFDTAENLQRAAGALSAMHPGKGVALASALAAGVAGAATPLMESAFSVFHTFPVITSYASWLLLKYYSSDLSYIYYTGCAAALLRSMSSTISVCTMTVEHISFNTVLEKARFRERLLNVVTVHYFRDERHLVQRGQVAMYGIIMDALPQQNRRVVMRLLIEHPHLQDQLVRAIRPIMQGIQPAQLALPMPALMLPPPQPPQPPPGRAAKSPVRRRRSP